MFIVSSKYNTKIVELSHLLQLDKRNSDFSFFMSICQTALRKEDLLNLFKSETNNISK